MNRYWVKLWHDAWGKSVTKVVEASSMDAARESALADLPGAEFVACGPMGGSVRLLDAGFRVRW